MMRTDRRRCAGLLMALAALAGAASCSSGPSSGSSSSGSTLTVLTPWTDLGEEAAFQQVLDEFERENPGITVNVVPSRALDQVLQSDVQRGAAPDLAVMPNPGALQRYATEGDLVRLDQLQDRSLDAGLLSQLRTNYGPQWLGVEEEGTGHPYAVVVKASVKSLIWYDPKLIGSQSPATWSQLLALDASLTRQGDAPWCLGLADPPASGWPGTDWIEDILLHQSGARIYGEWLNGRLSWTSAPVTRAWQTWGQIVATAGQVYGGAASALLTGYGSADYPLFATARPRCDLSHGALITLDPAGPAETEGTDYDFFTFPTLGVSQPAYEVSGDLMAMFRDSPQAEKLIAFLASDTAQRVWPSQQPDLAFSPDRRVAASLGTTYAKDAVAARIDSLLMSPTATLCFDASDSMPDAMETAFYRGVLEYVQDPTRLGAILAQLDQVRAGEPEGRPQAFACGSGS